MQTTAEYRTDAIKLIRQYNFAPLLKDEDHIGSVMTAIMMADHTFDGRGHIKGWRALSARHEMIRILKREKKHIHESLSEYLYHFDNNTVLIRDVLEQLIPARAEAIYQKIFYRLTFKEIATKMKISTERARTIYYAGLEDFKCLWNK